MQAQCHRYHSDGLQWSFGAEMNKFILNNCSCQREDLPNSLAASQCAGEKGGKWSLGPTWNIRKEKTIEKTRGSLTFASSLTWTGNRMLKSQQRDLSLQSLPVLITQHTTFTCIPIGMQKGRKRLFGYIYFSTRRCSAIKDWDQRDSWCSDVSVKQRSRSPTLVVMLRITLSLSILATGSFQTSVTCRMSHSISFLLDIQLQWLCMKRIKSGAFSLSSGSCYWFYPDRYLAPTHDEKSFKREREKNS